MSGAIGQKDYGRISHALETLSAMQLFIDDTANIGVLEMRAKARRLQAEHGLSLLVVDYIQLMSGRGRFENRTLELASISRSLKGLAKELNVPIVVLSQLSRAPGVALGPSPAALRPARVGRARAGRRRRRPDLSRRCLQQGSEQSRRRHRGADRRQAAQRSDRRRAARVPARADALRQSRTRRVGVISDSQSPIARRRSRSALQSQLRDHRTIRSTVAHVDLAALQQLPAIQHYLSDQRRPGIIAVVKANAYGHGAERVALALEQAGATMLACADIEEGIVLRQAGVRVPILVFGALSVSDLDGLFEFSLTPTISTPGAARAVQAAAAQTPDDDRLSPEDRHRHEPARVPPRQPAPDAAGAARQREPAARGGLHALRVGRRARESRLQRPARALRGGVVRRHELVPASRKPRSSEPEARTLVASRLQQRRAAARLARLVRRRAARAAALRHRAAAAGVDDSAHAGDVADQPCRRGERAAAGRRRRLRLALQADAPRTDRGRSRRVRRWPRHAAVRPRPRADSRPARADRRRRVDGHDHRRRHRPRRRAAGRRSRASSAARATRAGSRSTRAKWRPRSARSRGRSSAGSARESNGTTTQTSHRGHCDHRADRVCSVA